MFRFFLFIFLVFSSFQTATACELCSIFNTVDNQEREKKDLFLGLAYRNQYSDSKGRPAVFNILSIEAERQKLESHIWQIMTNYFVSDVFSLQINIPLIRREFTRFNGNSFAKGEEEGLGDVTFLAKYIPLQKHYGKLNYRLELFGGLKTPTGNSDPLAEILIEPSLLRHGGIAGSLIGGDDLTLGTGSYDTVIGSTLYLQHSRIHILGNLQYMIKTEGDYNYKFGNDSLSVVFKSWILLIIKP